MEKQKLQELLEELHKELEQTSAVDESTTERLEALKADIERFVKNEASLEECDEGFQENLRDAVSDFEVQHPKLSMAIQYVLDNLARMGF